MSKGSVDVAFEGVNGEHIGADADACADADLPCVVGHTQAVREYKEGDVEEGQRADGGQDDGFEGLHLCVVLTQTPHGVSAHQASSVCLRVWRSGERATLVLSLNLQLVVPLGQPAVRAALAVEPLRHLRAAPELLELSELHSLTVGVVLQPLLKIRAVRRLRRGRSHSSLDLCFGLFL